MAGAMSSLRSVPPAATRKVRVVAVKWSRPLFPHDRAGTRTVTVRSVVSPLAMLTGYTR